MWAPSLVQPLRPFAVRQAIDATLLARSSGKSSSAVARQGCRSYHALPKSPQHKAGHDSIAVAATRSSERASGSREQGSTGATSMLVLVGSLGLAASYATWRPRTLHCEPIDEQARAYAQNAARNFSNGSSDNQGRDPASGEYPKSDVNLYNLGFGTVCGICAGVFIKKGAKVLAFFLGGGFILLQYLNTQRIIKVDWRAMGKRYDSAIKNAAGEEKEGPFVFNNKQATGWRDSTAARLWSRFTHFLTADFPSRGTFLAGLVLGLRLG